MQRVHRPLPAACAPLWFQAHSPLRPALTGQKEERAGRCAHRVEDAATRSRTDRVRRRLPAPRRAAGFAQLPTMRWQAVFQRSPSAAARARSGARAAVSSDFILGQRRLMSGSDVHGQTRPGAEKQLGQPPPAAQVTRLRLRVSSLKPLPAPVSIPMVYANQLTSSIAALQSP